MKDSGNRRRPPPLSLNGTTRVFPDLRYRT
jgi:hypothetical protein